MSVVPQIQKQGLWLWAGALSLLLIATLPLAIEGQAVAVLVVIAVMVMHWRRSQHAGDKSTEMQRVSGVTLPVASYRHPVVLVVGDCLAEVFDTSPTEPLMLRVTAQGCYIPVPDLLKLPATVADLLLERPEWDGQLSVMWVVNPRAHVVQTTFVLNGEKHHYFNQRESWQRFRWPGQGDYPGISLTWSSVYTGERLFADYQGTWGLIRLLEQATVSALDDRDSRFRVVLSAPDGLGLTWHLRTELGEGPLALLKLRDFNLPREIFVVDDRDSQRYTQNGGFE